ncbi:hypothetical protein IV417_01390 [Alphaproteobacteria bacterium KMM 3653]|uniref:AAA+ family ATPase n=1 Tax=Harenicola maris TaxID=2841044 RepID=A0AAP2CMW6_9RHOB|nr:hypothetical protein [Harenicola maris]
MKQIAQMTAALCASAFLLAVPAPAQEAPSDIDEGVNLVEEGMKLFFRGLSKEIEPALEDFANEIEPALRGLVEEMGPTMEELAGLIGEMDQYHAPEKLPNGDIILRRKVPLEPVEPLPEGQTDL